MFFFKKKKIRNRCLYFLLREMFFASRKNVIEKILWGFIYVRSQMSFSGTVTDVTSRLCTLQPPHNQQHNTTQHIHIRIPHSAFRIPHSAFRHGTARHGTAQHSTHAHTHTRHSTHHAHTSCVPATLFNVRSSFLHPTSCQMTRDLHSTEYLDSFFLRDASNSTNNERAKAYALLVKSELCVQR